LVQRARALPFAESWCSSLECLSKRRVDDIDVADPRPGHRTRTSACCAARAFAPK
jgi:hypothetical protein